MKETRLTCNCLKIRDAGAPNSVLSSSWPRFVDHDWTIISILKAADVSILRVGIAENFQGFLIIVGNGPLRL